MSGLIDRVKGMAKALDDPKNLEVAMKKYGVSATPPILTDSIVDIDAQMARGGIDFDTHVAPLVGKHVKDFLKSPLSQQSSI